jgi:hypothetical protein
VLALIVGWIVASTNGFIELGIITFSIFAAFSLVPLTTQRRLVVTNTQLEFQSLIGSKRVVKLEGIQAITYTYMSGQASLSLNRSDWRGGNSVDNEWKAAFPTIIEAVHAINPNLEIEEIVLKLYGEPPYGIFGL